MSCPDPENFLRGEGTNFVIAKTHIFLENREGTGPPITPLDPPMDVSFDTGNYELGATALSVAMSLGNQGAR